MSRVTSSVSYGINGSARKRFRGTSASSICALTRSSAEFAAMPASSSPERRGVALARRLFRLMIPVFEGELLFGGQNQPPPGVERKISDAEREPRGCAPNTAIVIGIKKER